jgi:DNA polymerase (family 10)
MDLNDINVMNAKKMGVKLCLGTDSHKLKHLAAMELGISVARRGWLAKSDLLNCLPQEALIKWLKKY